MSLSIPPSGALSSAALLLSTAMMFGCTFDRSGLGECRSDGDCPSGRCINRVCARSVDILEDRLAYDASDAADVPTPDAAEDAETDVSADIGADDSRDLQTGCDVETAYCDDAVAVTCGPGGQLVELDCDHVDTCPDDEFGCRCAAGECVARVCWPDAIGCADNSVVDCNEDGAEFDLIERCGEGEICLGFECVGDTCSPEQRRCVNDVLVDCSAEGNVVIEVDCAQLGQYCDDLLLQCQPRNCEPGERRCASIGEVVEECDARGVEFAPVETCQGQQLCDAGACTGTVCTPNSAVCEEGFTRLRICDATGMVLTVEECGTDRYCDSSAEPDQCETQVCRPGQAFCNDDGDVWRCDALGSSSTFEDSCDYTCDGGVCQPAYCGDGLVTPSEDETCDDENDALCDGCEGCQELYGLGLTTTTAGTGTPPSWSPGTSDLTIEAWVNAASSGTLVGLGIDNGDHAYLAIDGAGRPYFRFDLGEGRELVLTGPTAVTGGWHHLAGTRFSTDRGALFVDGVMVALADGNLDYSEINDGAIWLGSDGTTTSAEAIIDEVRISNAQRYGVGFSPQRRYEPDGNTVALFHLDESADSTVTDGSGTGRDLSVSNVTWAADSCYGSSNSEAVCGDSGLAPWEDCDLGDTMPNDGCSATCEYELDCGTGGFLGPHRTCLVAVENGSWQAAEDFCTTWGGHLLTIEDAPENTWITWAAAGSPNFWIGLNDLDVEGTFVWVDGYTSAYRAWNGGEPNNSGGSENCAEFNSSSGGWNDLPCDRTMLFVCER